MKITNDIIYIGVNDHDIDLFEGQYVVPNGMSYNSYAIMDEKIAIMDTVDARFTHQWIDNIQNALEGRKPDYLVIQHMEPDHSANILNFIKAYPETTVVSSQKAFVMMKNFFGTDFAENRIVVGEGATLNLGKHSLTFVTAPMVHWPEVIMSYESSTGILFSADAFGAFGALDGKIFNDEILIDESWYGEARRYYANIVGKYGMQVQAVLKKAAALDIKMIAPLHGPVWRTDIGDFIAKYDLWSGYQPETKGVLVAYASMYGNTENAANALALALADRGVSDIQVRDVSVTDLSEMISLAWKYSHIVIAAPTYNMGIHPKMEHLLLDMKALNLRNRTVAIIENGSWAPAVIKVASEIFSSMKNITVMEEKISIRSALHDVAPVEKMADAIVPDLNK